MRIRPFEYHAPGSVTEALALLAGHGAQAKVLAGGTDLVLTMKRKGALPAHLVDIGRLGELDFVREVGDEVRIGALRRHADLARDPLLRRWAPGLCEAVGLIGSWQIRSVGTLGGNLCNASPAADSTPYLLALDASVVLVDGDGETQMPLGAFFRGPGATVLRPGQILKEIVFRRPPVRSAGRYLKLRRRKGVDISLASTAVHLEVNGDGATLGRVAVALGGVAATAIRVPEAEALLAGLAPQEALERVPECAQAVVNASRPITDIRATADYRRHILSVFTRRALGGAIEELFGKGAPA